MNETAECLVRCRLPTLRYQPPSSPCIDRYMGLCAPLMPQLYDISQLSNDLLNNVAGNIGQRFKTLEAAVQNWRPSVPPEFMDTFSSVEVSHMICQASVMQTAALLVMHRLQHPFGEEEGKAHAMASLIVTQIDSTRRVTGETPLYVDFPLLVACLEIRDRRRMRHYVEDAYSTPGSLGLL